MKILVSCEDATTLRSVAGKLRATPKISMVKPTSDLTEAYNFAEHNTPDVCVVHYKLALLPEFEVMHLLLKALDIRCVIGLSGLMDPELKQQLTSRTNAECIDVADLSDYFGATPAKPPIHLRQGRKSRSDIKVADGDYDSRKRILIGASTGGVDALLKLLSEFPRNCPPTLIVQHTGAAFSKGLANLLDQRVSPKVSEARNGAQLTTGHVFIAPGSEAHLVLSRSNPNTCELREAPPEQGHRPSVDALFHSGVPFAKTTVAAILTGMGRDGAAGITALRKAGATTIGQDAETSVVYGMPKVAFDMGGIENQLPISAIGSALLGACKTKFGSVI